MALLFASAVFSFPGCTEEEGPAAPDPIITITTDSPVTAEAAGGSDYYFEYTVENEVEGATVTCDVTYNGTETEWISIDDEQASAGKITFGIGYYENTEAGRTAVITIIYTYGDGKTVSDEIEVSQTQAEAAPEPVLSTVSQETAKAAAAENATIDVEIYNPVEGATVTVSTEGFADPAIDPEDPWLTAEWVEGESYTSDSGTPILSGTIKYSVTANETSDERTAHITLTYKYGENEEDVKESVIDFTQEAGGLEFVFVREMSTEVITSYTAPAEGGTCGVQYKTSGNQSYDNDAVTFSVDYSGDSQNWITINDNDMVGYLSFNTTANTTGEARSAVITLNYENDGLTASASITINQEPKVGGAEPEITVSGLGEDGKLHLSGEAEEYASIYVEVSGAEGLNGTLSGTCYGATWISDIKGSSFGTSLTFTVSQNTGSSERSAVITVYYTWDGGEVKKEVEIVQGVNYSIELNSSSIDIPGDGVEDEYVYFDIIPYSPDPQGILSAEPDETWISNIRISDTYDSFTFDAEPNEESSERMAIITLTFTPNNGGTPVEEYIYVYQAAKPVAGVGGDYTPAVVSAIYYKGENGGADEYQLMLMASQTGQGGKFFYFDLFSTASDGTKIPEGQYAPGTENAANTFNTDMSYYTMVYGSEGTAFEFGVINISYEGDNIVIKATVGAADGTEHNITYTGTIDIW